MRALRWVGRDVSPKAGAVLPQQTCLGGGAGDAEESSWRGVTKAGRGQMAVACWVVG